MNGIKTNEKIIIGRTDLAKDEYEKYYRILEMKSLK